MKDREKVRKRVREEKDTVRRRNRSGNLPLVSLIPEANFPSLIPAEILSPVTTTPVVNANLTKDVTTGVIDTGGAHLLEKFSPNFRKNRNGAVEIIRGMGEGDPRKKTGGKKSLDTIPLKYGSGKALAGANPTGLEVTLLHEVRFVFG